ncbi:hypothetical protein [Amycolatopsis speibonae]
MTSTLYEPGLNSSAFRFEPNWLVSCCENTLLTWDWIADCDMPGSKTSTFGPRSGSAVPVTGVSWKDWAPDPLQEYCCSWVLSCVERPGRSRHLPLLRLTK